MLGLRLDPGGLKGNAYEILKSIYASYAGPLQILLHLGTLAVEDKWTAESVSYTHLTLPTKRIV